MPAANPTTPPNPTAAQAQAADAGGDPAADYAAQQAAKEAAYAARIAKTAANRDEEFEREYSPTLTIFDPPDRIIPKILNDLSDPDYTLRDIAEKAKTTLDALTAWMAKPDIAERLSNLEGASARRTRLIATNHLPSLVTTLQGVLERYESRCSHSYIDPSTVRGAEYQRRADETARKAAALLVRLARYYPGAPRRRSGSPSQMGARAGGRVRAAQAHQDSNPAPTAPNATDALALVQLLLAQLKQPQPPPLTTHDSPLTSPHSNGHSNGHVNRLPSEDLGIESGTAFPGGDSTSDEINTTDDTRPQDPPGGSPVPPQDTVTTAVLPIPLPQLKSAPPARPGKSPQPKSRNRPP